MSIIGTVAAILTTSAFVPQAIKTIRTRDTEGLSLPTFTMLFLGTVLWTIYGIGIGDKPIIYANIITGFLAGIIVCLKLNAVFFVKKK